MLPFLAEIEFIIPLTAMVFYFMMIIQNDEINKQLDTSSLKIRYLFAFVFFDTFFMTVALANMPSIYNLIGVGVVIVALIIHTIGFALCDYEVKSYEEKISKNETTDMQKAKIVWSDLEKRVQIEKIMSKLKAKGHNVTQEAVMREKTRMVKMGELPDFTLSTELLKRYYNEKMAVS